MNRLLAFALPVFVLASCAVKPTAGTALFDYFSYEGQDSFYSENPLPSEDYAYNPILPGWYSDPSICSNGKGDYFLVTSTFSYFPGVPIFHSKDLLNWEQIGNVLSRSSQLQNLERQHVSGGIYAPDIKYNPYNETYYCITTNVGAGNFVVKTKDPFGEWSDPIMLPAVQGIDPSLFFDDDGRAYIVNNDDAPDGKPEYDGHRTIRVVEFDVKSDSTVGERKIIVDKGSRPEDKPIWIEGPHLYKINGSYYLMCAEGGTGDQHSEVIFRSDSPTEGFVPWQGNPILTQRHLSPDRARPVTCTGHADLIQAEDDGSWWAVFLACRPIMGRFENTGRETFMLPVRWTDDGFPVITSGNEVVARSIQRPGVKRAERVTYGNFTVRDDFTSASLGLEWMTLKGPAAEYYSLSDRPGYLELRCSDTRANHRDVPSAVLRRIQHQNFQASTRMYFEPGSEGEGAGMLLFKDEFHSYFFKLSSEEGAPTISLVSVNLREEKVLASERINDRFEFIDLKINSSRGLAFAFSYALNGLGWKTLAKGVSAEPLSTASAGGFTGTTIGLYAIK